MQFFQDISIKNKIMVLTMSAVLTAMSLACTAFVIDHVYERQEDATREILAIANLVGANTSASMTFDDKEMAEKLLSSLELDPMITFAVLYGAEGGVFATHPTASSPESIPPLPHFVGARIRRGHLEVVEPVIENNEQIGTIYLQSDLAFIWSHVFLDAMTLMIVMIVSCGAAYLLTSRLQSIISGPILDLTYTAQQISQNKDYGIRVRNAGNDELGTLCDKFNQMLEQIEASNLALEHAHDELELRVEARTHELKQTNSQLSKEIVERRRAEIELEFIHRDFVDAARKAGMAEIATGVLHDVGNVLNSVNVSATMLTNQIKASKVSQLKQVMDMLSQHEADIGDFVSNDEKGKQVPRFLKVLTEHLAADEESMLEEAKSLISNVDHIKTIISMQQAYATSGGLLEPFDINVILDDALKIHSGSFSRHGILLETDYAEMPTVLIDKQRVLQIAINLIKNAKESMQEQVEGQRVLRVSTRAKGDQLIIEVSDTGVGIDKTKISRIFSHGFTTKSTGHGFGLHSCANAATEMEGKLTVRSDGRMKGATFTLELPLNPATVSV